MNKKIFFILIFCSTKFLFAQQNEEFQNAKKYFDYQRFMLNNEFKKKFDIQEEQQEKINIKKDFSEFMIKLDSIQNTAFIGTLIKVKNREDLERWKFKQTANKFSENPSKSDLSKEAKYPGGFDTLRQQVSELFYTDAILPEDNLMKTNVIFVVEKDGSISSVHAEGDHFAFNRQAEIAMYLLPQKFSPAMINGTAVRYRYRLPLAMKFE